MKKPENGKKEILKSNYGSLNNRNKNQFDEVSQLRQQIDSLTNTVTELTKMAQSLLPLLKSSNSNQETDVMNDKQ